MLRSGHAILLCVLALLTLGLVMVTSAGLRVNAVEPISLSGILTSRTMVYALVAIALMGFGILLNPRWLEKWPLSHRLGIGSPGAVIAHPAAWVFLGSVVLLLLVYVDGVGRHVNGARRWINLGPASLNLGFQPSEVAKWAMVIVIACYAAARGPEMRRFWTGLVPGLVLTLVICGIIVLEDLGTAVLIGMVGVLLLWAAGARWWHIAVLLPLPATAIVGAVLVSPYRVQRILTFLDPYADPGGAGYQMIQSMSTIAHGEVTGRGLGHGVFKFGYLPEDTTDFLFSVVCEELGVFGAGLVIFLYAVLLLAGLSIIRRETSAIGRLIGLGVLLTVGLQTLINLLVVTGLAPTKGIALPLMSSGGTGWILTALALGILIGMDRRQAREDTMNVDESVEAGMLPAVVSIAAPKVLATSQSII